MVVVQVVDRIAPVATPHDEPEVPQHAQLMRDGRGLHPNRLGKLTDRLDAGAQPPQDPHPAGGRERLHRLRDGSGEVRVQALGVMRLAVAHDIQNGCTPVHTCRPRPRPRFARRDASRDTSDVLQARAAVLLAVARLQWFGDHPCTTVPIAARCCPSRCGCARACASVTCWPHVAGRGDL